MENVLHLGRWALVRGRVQLTRLSACVSVRQRAVDFKRQAWMLLTLLGATLGALLSGYARAQAPRVESGTRSAAGVDRFVLARLGGAGVRRGVVDVRMRREGTCDLRVSLDGDIIPGLPGRGGVVSLPPGCQVVKCISGPGLLVSGVASGRAFLDVVDLEHGPLFRRIHEESEGGDITVLAINNREGALYLLVHATSEIVRIALRETYPLEVMDGVSPRRVLAPAMWKQGGLATLDCFDWPGSDVGCANGGYLVVRDIEWRRLGAWRLLLASDGMRLNRIRIRDVDYAPEVALQLRLSHDGDISAEGEQVAQAYVTRWRSRDGRGGGRSFVGEKVSKIDMGSGRVVSVLDAAQAKESRGCWLSAEGVGLSPGRPLYVPWHLGGASGGGEKMQLQVAAFTLPFPGCEKYQIAVGYDSEFATESECAYLVVATVVDLGEAKSVDVRKLLRQRSSSAVVVDPGYLDIPGAWCNIAVPAKARPGQHLLVQVHSFLGEKGGLVHSATTDVFAVELVAGPISDPRSEVWEFGVNMDMSSPMSSQAADLLEKVKWP